MHFQGHPELHWQGHAAVTGSSAAQNTYTTLTRHGSIHMQHIAQVHSNSYRILTVHTVHIVYAYHTFSIRICIYT